MIRAQITVLIAVVSLLTACPRIAYIDVYNNTTVQLEVTSSGHTDQVQPGSDVRLPLTGQKFSIKSDIGHWVYRRNIPHDGEEGNYFDGVLRVQINENGHAYALSTETKPPTSDVNEQPEGFPLIPATMAQPPRGSGTDEI